MKKTFNHWTDFVTEMAFEFSASSNERLKSFINLATTLHQGCSCTRRKRMEMCDNEYLAIGTYLDENSINLMKTKYQGHQIEFAKDGGVFFLID